MEENLCPKYIMFLIKFYVVSRRKYKIPFFLIRDSGVANGKNVYGIYHSEILSSNYVSRIKNVDFFSSLCPLCLPQREC